MWNKLLNTILLTLFVLVGCDKENTTSTLTTHQEKSSISIIPTTTQHNTDITSTQDTTSHTQLQDYVPIDTYATIQPHDMSAQETTVIPNTEQIPPTAMVHAEPIPPSITVYASDTNSQEQSAQINQQPQESNIQEPIQQVQNST